MELYIVLQELYWNPVELYILLQELYWNPVELYIVLQELYWNPVELYILPQEVYLCRQDEKFTSRSELLSVLFCTEEIPTLAQFPLIPLPNLTQRASSSDSFHLVLDIYGMYIHLIMYF